MPIPQLGGELGWPIHNRVYLPAEPSLGLCQSLGNDGQRDIANYHYVHVACLPLPPLGERAEQECDSDLHRQWLHRGPKRVRHANGLDDERSQFFMYRRGRIGTIQELVAHLPALKHADLRQQLEFPLDWAEGRSC